MFIRNRLSAWVRPVLWRAPSIALVLSLLFFSVALAASGSLDTTFSGDGRANTDVNAAHRGRDDKAIGEAIQSDGKIVLAGYSTDDAASYDIALVRYNPNGSLDKTFSGDGRVITNLGALDQGFGVAIQPDGRIVVTGTRCTGAFPAACKLAVLRYNTNGTLDTTFNGTGHRLVAFKGGIGSSGGVVIQSDGKIVVSGTVFNGSDFDWAVIRLNSNGSMDTTFSGDGKQSIGFGPGSDDESGYGNDIAVQTDGKIVMGGGAHGDLAVARLNPNGTLDKTFSGDGRQTTDFGNNEFGWAVALQSNGKILVAGNSDDGAGSSVMAVARYNPKGSLDLTFNGTGKQTVDFAGSSNESARSVVVQSNGKILLAGASENDGGDFALARLTAGGHLDATFSGDGMTTIDFAGGFDICRSIAIDSKGRYVLAGAVNTGTSTNFGAARVLP